MKISCEIIRDLMPLVEEEVCSAQSRHAVMEHMKECEECRSIYESSKNYPDFTLSAEEEAEKQAIQKGVRKIKRKWRMSIASVLLSIPVLYLSWGQYTGNGLAFTNIREMMIAKVFLHDLEQGDYEAAFQHIDLNWRKKNWIEQQWFEEDDLNDKNMEEDAERVFCESASLLKEAGGIKSSKFCSIEDEAEGYYQIYYTIEVDGNKRKMWLDVGDNGVKNFGVPGDFTEDPAAHFSIWSELLWQEYKGCYWNPEAGQYIYH